MAGTAADMVATMRGHIGLGEPNYIQKAFAKTQSGSYWGGNWPWCQATVWYVSKETNNFDVVMFNKNDAYTVTCAQRFVNAHEWVSGTTANCKKAQPGWIVYFDWGGTNSVGRIDHVGVVEKNLGGGRVQTIEGNIGDAVRRKVRESGVIAGFGIPKYKAAAKPAPYKWDGKAPSGAVVLEMGDNRKSVKDLQSALNKAMVTKLTVDGEFGPATEKALKAFQKKAKLTQDGQYGKKSAAALAKMLGGVR